MAVARREVKTDDEEMILVGLITSDAFCKQIAPILVEDHLTNRYARTVSAWALEYWEQYKIPIDKDIASYYRAESHHLPDDESRLIEELLHSLSNRYANDPVNNWDYWIDRARDYLRGRSLALLTDTVKLHLNRDDIVKAESAVYNYLAPSAAGPEIVFPFIDRQLQLDVAAMIEADGIFRYHGAVGKLVGGLDRGWLVAFFGPPKRGKTFWLTETAVQGIMQKLKVLFVSIEMKKKPMTKRFIQNATSLPDRKGEITVPVWDCVSHQSDSCDLPNRVESVLAPKDKDGHVFWDPDSRYKPCAACKGHKKLEENYRPASWFRLLMAKETFADKIVERSEAFAKQYYGGNLALVCYPRFGGTIEMIEGALDALRAKHGFVPDMIVIDYADILKEEGRDERERLDRIWKKLGGIAFKHDCIVMTASQTNRKSVDARTVRQADIAEDFRKAAHLDVSITLNQLESEKETMMMRVGIMHNRHREAPTKQVFVLQNYSLGQPAMDTFVVSRAMAEIIGDEDDFDE